MQDRLTLSLSRVCPVLAAGRTVGINRGAVLAPALPVLAGSENWAAWTK